MAERQLLPRDYSRSRQEVILAELRIAMNSTSRPDLSAWGVRSGRVLVGAGVRRVRAAKSLTTSAAGMVTQEVKAVKDSSSMGGYLVGRADALSTNLKSLMMSASQIWRGVSTYCRDNPIRAGSQLVLLCFGFKVGSGGIDGDGGLPDLDWTLLESHRSLLTHSVVPAIVVEVAVLALVDLIATIHDHLPQSHDPIWDSIRLGSKELELISLGTSLGLAYHLGTDATVDGGGHYQGLPVSLPQEGHQAIAATFSAIEGLDGMARLSERGDVLATYGTLSLAAKSIRSTATPSSFVVKRLRNEAGFKVLWMPKQT